MLNGAKWGADNGASVMISTEVGECARWHLRYMGDGYYVITNHDSGLSLEGSSNNTATNTTGVVQWARTGTDRQLWRLVPASATVEFEAPAAPTGLEATSQSASVLLSWNANTEDDLLGYMIYRYNEQAGLWDCIARQVKGETFIDNTCPKEQVHRYRIRAVDQAWNLSDASAEVECSTATDAALIGEWHLKENLDDVTENRFHGVSTGVGFDNDTHAAATFNGSNYISLPYHIANLHSMTFSAWVKSTSSTSWQRIFDFGRNTDNYIMLTPNNGSRLRFEICKNGEKQGLNATQSLSQDVWTLVTVTIGDDGVRIYLNGELNASTNNITFRPADISPCLSYVGRSMFASDPLFRGSIGDVMLYNYALSADQVKALMYHEQLAVASDLLLKPMYKETRQTLQQRYEEAEAAIMTGDNEERTAALNALTDAEADARISIASYEPLVEALNHSAAMAEAHPQSDSEAMSRYNALFAEALQNCYDGEWTDDAIDEQLIVVETFTNQYLMIDVKAKATEDRPVDITYIMNNADFASNTLMGWTLTTDEPSYRGDFYEGCFEIYNHTFNLAHYLYGMPSGIYRLAVQGFYRCGPREDIETATDANAMIYIGESEIDLNLITRGAGSRISDGSWYEYSSGSKVPDDMQAAYSAFNTLNRYRPSSLVNTVEGTYDATLGEPLQVGLRKTVAVDRDWTIVNYFNLRYCGDPTATGIETTSIDQPLSSNDKAVYDLTGRRISTLSKGLYIIDGKKVLVK